jgi:hypothetical protein
VSPLIHAAGSTQRVMVRAVPFLQTAQHVLNVDINNFDFDYVVLVNLTEDYRPLGMWKLSADEVRRLAADRGKFNKFQLTQKEFTQAAVPIEVISLRVSLGG